MSEGDVTFARAGDGEAGDRADAAAAVCMPQTGLPIQTVSGIFSKDAIGGDGG